MAQMVERVLGKDEVTGSIPVISSIENKPRQRISVKAYLVFIKNLIGLFHCVKILCIFYKSY